MLSYRATLDAPSTTAARICGWLTAHRRAHDVRPERRAATTRVQAVMLLRWMAEGTAVEALARDSGVSLATAYRYLHEALEVVARRTPDLNETLEDLHRRGEPHACLDGTPVRTDRVAARNPQAGHHLWYSGKHKAFGANVQVLTDRTGFPVWLAPAEPGSTHDVAASRTHVLPALHKAASRGMPTPADKGYIGSGIGIRTPFRNPDPDTDTRQHNQLVNAMRAPAERANAMLKHYKALRHVTLDPATVTTITRAALALIHLQKPHRTQTQ